MTLQPGVYHNISEADYHALPFVSQSYLKELQRSAAHAEIKKEKTDSMNLGSLVHRAAFEPESWGKVELYEKPARRDAKWKREVFEPLCAEHGEENVIDSDQYLEICNIAAAVHNTELASKLRNQPHDKEFVIIWDEGDIRCKARIDTFYPTLGIIYDLKTSANADPRDFPRNSIFKYGYHIQSAMYRRAVIAARLHDNPAFVVHAVETSKPYGVAVFEFDAECISFANSRIETLLARHRAVKDLNPKPGYSKHPYIVRLPAWMKVEGQPEQEIPLEDF